MTKAKLLQLIHIASKQLRLDEDTYRQMLYAYSGKRSTRDMDIMQLSRVLDAMKQRGWKVKPAKSAKAPIIKTDELPQIKKLRALWLTLADNGAVRDRSEKALLAWVKRETGIDNLQWLSNDDASQSIEKLKKWLNRVTRKKP